jgi:hypothetical protein
MKKLLVLVALFTFVFATANAQQGNGDQATRLERYKETVKPQLIEKTKITEAQADKVIAIHFSYSGRMRDLNKIADEQQRKSQIESLEAAERKEYTAVPLTEAEITAVNAFFLEQKKKIQKNYNAPISGN